MFALLRGHRRLTWQLAVACGVVLMFAHSPQGSEGAAPPPVQVAQLQSPEPQPAPEPGPAVVTPMPTWEGERLLPQAPVPQLDAVVPVAPAPELTSVPEPSVIVILLGGVGLSLLVRPRRHA